MWIEPIDAAMAELAGPEETSRKKAIVDHLFEQAKSRMEGESAKDFNDIFKICVDEYNASNQKYVVEVEIKSENGSKGELIIGVDYRHKN